jgi:hypothetical protein
MRWPERIRLAFYGKVEVENGTGQIFSFRDP